MEAIKKAGYEPGKRYFIELAVPHRVLRQKTKENTTVDNKAARFGQLVCLMADW